MAPKPRCSIKSLSELTMATMGTMGESATTFADDATSATSSSSLYREAPSQRRRNRLWRKLQPPSFRAQNVSLSEYPGSTLQYLARCMLATPPFFPRVSKSAVLATTLCLLLHFSAKEGHLVGIDLQQQALWLQELVLDTLFWIGCGLLSTVGLGSGVPTGALYLFPYVCRCALRQQSSLASLLWTVFWPGFWSGSGSALGEMVPFLLARRIRDPFCLLNHSEEEEEEEEEEEDVTVEEFTEERSCKDFDFSVEDNTEESLASSFSRTEVLLANTRRAMEDQLQKQVFWKVFTLALIPNFLFDLAGLVCGAAQSISLRDFFWATWTAKALVRTPLQTCVLALAVVALASPNHWAASTETMINATTTMARPQLFSDPTADHLWSRWSRLALTKFVGQDEGFLFGQQETPTMPEAILLGAAGACWRLLTILFFGFFIVGTIEQIAQYYLQTHPPHHKKTL